MGKQKNLITTLHWYAMGEFIIRKSDSRVLNNQSIGTVISLAAAASLETHIGKITFKNAIYIYIYI